MSHHIRCGCCHGLGTIPILTAPDKAGHPITIFHCTTCCALSPSYSDTGEAGLAEQIEFHDAFWQLESRDDILKARDSMRGLLEFHARLLPPLNTKHIIYDIGCGRGNLLAALLAEGFEAYGCEPSHFLYSRATDLLSIKKSHHVNCTGDDFLDSREHDKGNVDVIFLWHVIEHLSNPVDFLKRIPSFLKDTGVVICQGPMLAADYVYREHFFFHSESNIVWLAKESGLKLIFQECQSSERFGSFVLAHPAHPSPEVASVFLNEPLWATGALYYTMDRVIRHLRARSS